MGAVSGRAGTSFKGTGKMKKRIVIAGWYKYALGLWIISGLPVLVLAYGFSGGDMFGIPGLYGMSTLEAILAIGGWVLILYPILFMPFGIKIRFARRR